MLPLAASLALFLAAQTLWQLALSRDDAAVVNGVLRPGSGGWIDLILTCAAWTFIVLRGLAIYDGEHERPSERAWRALPLALGAMFVIAVITFIAITLFVILRLPGFVALAGAIAMLLIVLRLAAPLLVAICVAVLEQPSRGAFPRAIELMRGGVRVTMALAGIGFVIPAAAALWLASEAAKKLDGTFGGFLLITLNALLAGLVAYFQILTFYWLRNQLLDPQLKAAPAAAQQGLGVTVVACLLIPGLLSLAVAKTGTLPELQSYAMTEPHSQPFPGQAQAVGWPDGGNPVLVGIHGIFDCQDAHCADVDETSFPHILDYRHGAAVDRNGNVFIAEHGTLTRCPYSTRICERSKPTLPFGSAEMRAIAVSTVNSTLMIATVRPVKDPTDPAKELIELGMVRCTDEQCADPGITRFGTILASFKAPNHYHLTRHLTVGSGQDGRPIVVFRPPSQPNEAWIAWCETIGCVKTGFASLGSPVPGMPTTEDLAPLAASVPGPCANQLCQGQTDLLASVKAGDRHVGLALRNLDEVAIHIGQAPATRPWLALHSCAEATCATRIDTHVLRQLGPQPTSASFRLRPPLWLMAADSSGKRFVVLSGDVNNFDDRLLILATLP